jgi:predicted Zn-dependent peptidase
VISAAVDNAAAGPAVREVFLELERLAQEPISKTELDDARCYLHGVFPYTLQTLQGLLARLEQLAVYDLPDHYFETFFEQLDACTAEDLQVLAQRYLAPGAMRVAVAGPAASLLPALSDLGPLRVEEPR